jgi:hypothetical protein
VSVSHSQGPWRLSAGDETAVFSANNQNIFNARCGGTGSPRLNEAEANARLCAAAPDLLEASTDALAGWRYIRAQHGDLYGVGWGRVEQTLAAAIAKATS